jgi:GNAT superfamily N-acetyltransferase
MRASPLIEAIVIDPDRDPELADAVARAEAAWLWRSDQIGAPPDEARPWLFQVLSRYRSQGYGSFDAWVANITASIDEVADEVQHAPINAASGLARVQAKYRDAVE